MIAKSRTARRLPRWRVAIFVAVFAAAGASLLSLAARRSGERSGGTQLARAGSNGSTAPAAPTTIEPPAQPTTTAPVVATTAGSLAPATTTVADPTAVAWLMPSTSPAGLQLRSAHASLQSPGCPPIADCAGTVPSARLVWDTDDWRVLRTVELTEVLATPGTQPTTTTSVATERRAVGTRSVDVSIVPNGPWKTSTVRWLEDGEPSIAVELRTQGLDWDEVATFIGGLRRVAAPSFTEAENPPAQPCIGAPLQYAPEVPDGWTGWTRFVVKAPPTGTCGGDTTTLISIVRPGTLDTAGTLITVVLGPTTRAVELAASNTVIVGDHVGRFDSNRLLFSVGDVAIDVHGNASPEELVAVGATVHQLDDEAWAAVVAEVGQG